MKDYGARARRLFEEQQVPKNPWDESPEGIDGVEAPNTSPPSRVQVLNFDDNDQTSYDSSRDFLASWQNNDYSIDETTSKVSRRLLIVECMDPLVLELLGVKFKIPPEVFLAHFDGRVNINVRDSQWKSRGRSTYWRAYVLMYCGLVNDALDLLEVMVSNVGASTDPGHKSWRAAQDINGTNSLASSVTGAFDMEKATSHG